MLDQLHIYTNDTYITIVGKNIAAAKHKHYSHQITITKEKCTFIPAMMPHALTKNHSFAIILINPLSEDGRLLNSIIHETSINYDFDEHLIKRHIAPALLDDIYKLVLHAFIPEKPPLTAMDRRINEAIHIINDLDTKTIPAADLAKELFLSESRLAHLFKSEVGIPLRRYLLWLKLKDAIELIPTSTSFTEAAHKTGFSDSAHLARTCKEHFGIDLTTIFKHSRFIQVIGSKY